MTQVKTSSEPLAHDKLFSKTFFFRNITKTVISKQDIEEVYRTEFVGLLIYNNSLSRHILVAPTVFGIQGFEKSQKTPPPNFLEVMHGCAVQGRLSIPSTDKYFKRNLIQVKTFLEPLAPDKLFQKQFFRHISKTA